DSQFSILNSLDPHRHPLQEAFSLTLRFDLRILGKSQVYQTALSRRKRRQELLSARPLGFLCRPPGQLFQGFALLGSEPLRIETRIDGAAQTLAGDASRQHLQSAQPLSLIGEQRLDVVPDQLEEHFRSW